MQVEISEETYRAIAESKIDVTAFVEQAVRQALAKKKAPVATGDLVERFRSFRGMLRDTTIEDIVAARHRGLE